MSTDSAAPIRFGLIGVDSPHAPSFTRLFGNGFDGTVPGGTVTHAWKGVPASDFPLSRDRNDDFAAQVAALGVALCDSPEDVAQACDALLIVASDARTHPDYFRRLVEFGKPVYVDTRFAPTLPEARTMLALADASGTLVLAGSPKRFIPEFLAASGGPVRRAVLNGPLPTQPGHPGFSWYGVHLVDLAVAALGPGIIAEGVTVDASTAGSATIRWADHREAELSGEPEWSPVTSGRLESATGETAFSIEAGPAMLTGLLEGIVHAVRTGEPNVPPAEILDIVALVEALNRSLDTSAPVSFRSSCLMTLRPEGTQ
ncbi:Gfo/Idh/MocA family protein [Paenarthrobacter sp. NPDC018779]|uniref:Gfo/Idh/MocA family protein n=1 Tax=Paenarthrobacter sp. NPDC018779 TaxID=3364375 RepID=UPI0037C6D79F